MANAHRMNCDGRLCAAPLEGVRVGHEWVVGDVVGWGCGYVVVCFQSPRRHVRRSACNTERRSKDQLPPHAAANSRDQRLASGLSAHRAESGAKEK